MATTAGAPRRRLDALAKARRRERIFASLRLGSSTADIARAEGLTARRVRQIVGEALRLRPVDEAKDHALLQLARLEPAIKLLAGEVAQGDVGAIAPYLELIDRLDRYQGAGAAEIAYDDKAREALLAKLNRIVARQEKRKARRTAAPADAAGGAPGRDAGGAAAGPQTPPVPGASP